MPSPGTFLRVYPIWLNSFFLPTFSIVVDLELSATHFYPYAVNMFQRDYFQWSGYVNWTSWALFATAIFVAWIAWRRSRFVRLIEAMPGPPGLPILGNLLQVIEFSGWKIHVDQVEFLRLINLKWVAKYGGIYKGWGGFKPLVGICSPELMEPILTSQKLITKAHEYSYLSDWLGACMFLTTGDRWRTRRRMLTPAFHFQILESFFDVFNDRSQTLIEDLIEASEVAKKNDTDLSSSGKGVPINVYTILTQCALDIICDSSMGQLVRKKEETQDYLRSLNRIMQIAIERGVRPWLEYDFFFQHSALGKENRKCVQILHDFTNQVIQDRKKMLQSNNNSEKRDNTNNLNDDSPKRRLAFLDLLIQASENGTKLSDADIREEVDTFMFAGHDTTATAMGWFLYCIARNPHEQQLLFDEVDEIFEGSDRACTTQDAANLKYLDCAIKETLRLYPSIPTVLRTITEEVEIGGYTLPKGVTCALLIYGMHRHPDIYPDPDSFKPERFLPEQSAGRNPYAFIPFSAGPRNCIGQKYALLELKVVLSWMLRRLRFSVLDPNAPETKASGEIVLKPVDGIHLVVAPR